LRGFDANSENNAIEDALKYAFRLLGYRDRSEKEICEKLTRKGFSEDVCKNTIAYLMDRGFIDDRRLAEALKKNAVERKRLGKRGTRHYLTNKGIADGIIDNVLGSDDDYLNAAKSLVERKLRNVKDYDEKTIKKRLWGMLSRRGFSYEIIKKVLQSFNLKEEEK
jgi:regulatory protein